MAGKVAYAQLIAAPPALVVTVTADAFDFLNELPEPNFTNTADAKTLWATRSVAYNPSGASEGSVFPSTGGTATAWVVSAEAFKRLKAQRF